MNHFSTQANFVHTNFTRDSPKTSIYMKLTKISLNLILKSHELNLSVKCKCRSVCVHSLVPLLNNGQKHYYRVVNNLDYPTHAVLVRRGGVKNYCIFLTHHQHFFIPGDPVVITEDEEYKKVNFDKFKTLRTVFQKDGLYYNPSEECSIITNVKEFFFKRMNTNNRRLAFQVK